MVGLQRGCGAGIRRVVGGGVDRGISGRQFRKWANFGGNFVVSAVGSGILEVRRRRGVGNSGRRRQGDFVASTERFQEIEGGMGKVASGGWTGMRRA